MVDIKTNRYSHKELARHAFEIRRSVIKMVGRNGQGYVQQGLGAADIFTFLFFNEVTMDIKDPSWEGRDRIFLSTAHNSALFHATLAQRGVLSFDSLDSYTKDGSALEINVSERLGGIVEATCGSLGQGLSVAIGMALSGKRRANPFRCYVILGDGELQEGQTWEAAMFASAHRLENLCTIIDFNNLQADGASNDVMNMESLEEKWKSFGWCTTMIDGHNFSDLEGALNFARLNKDKPTVIIAKTLVGKGVSFLEGRMSHNMVFPLGVAQRALKELKMGVCK